ncbi:c6 zinc finger domain containing protein [Grosmannia clavigera kw1407]|uniref:C6 zinc finger domain containing protein n=1 Tax=Grosmannia clavigera (strain kw1407 / UAMH 11150) TaxID=655863 RepID=F0XMU4_GROCL|nr:c6 zinc finger domain containing protein [Grosmannia clavigera kw1407]EFX01023.1 c6 zinc finger domain containing protein [Grosmannia clavigera kw1407]
MMDEMDTNEGELSDALSENEYDDVHLQLLGERDDHEDHTDDHQDDDHDYDSAMDKRTDSKSIKTEAGLESTAPEPKKKYDPKDPLRPRRKKARRACYACQRAHLTCGDERPCQRCIKRGLADGCQDGVRKKAKYLHDAPADALRPVLGPNFNAGTTAAVTTTTTPSRTNGHRHPSSAGSDVSVSNVGTFYAQSNTAPYSVFSSGQTPSGTLAENLTFPGPQSPVSPSFVSTSGADGAAAQMNRIDLTAAAAAAGLSSFSPALFDPSNPALFNFNLEGINFGSQYAAMEFDMLGHMSSGAADDANDPTSSLSQQPGGGVGGFPPADVFGGGASQTLFSGGASGTANGLVNDFIGLDSSTNGFYSQGNLQHGLPHAYAIAAAPPSLQSPSTDNNSPQATGYGFEGSPTMATYAGSTGGVANGNGHVGQVLSGVRASVAQAQQQQHQQQQHQHQTPHQHQHQLQQHKARSAMAKLLPQSILGKRHRDPSSVYEMVKEPHMYVAGFHRLIALLQRRFSASKIVRIAKALSSIRPSFISCTRTLNRQDLVFMEKCFQRTLFEYEEFMSQVSSPAIVCRRTGEVAAVNKEFTALTGWTKEVLLGKAPNLNVNMGLSSAVAAAGGTGAGSGAAAGAGGGAAGAAGSVSVGGGSSTGSMDVGTTSSNGNANSSSSTNGGTNSGRSGLSTPRLRALNAEAIKASEGKAQPMFIAELMDDDNVIEFYEDFAHLAFGDSRGSVNRKCRLLKYRTREMLDSSAGGELGSSAAGSQSGSRPGTAGQQSGNGSGTAATGVGSSSILSNRVARIDGEHGISKIERDGKLECSYCWHIRRDTFDIPMMIVMNEPHQLAV